MKIIRLDLISFGRFNNYTIEFGDKSNETMTRRKLKDTCLLSEFEPRNIKYALENES